MNKGIFSLCMAFLIYSPISLAIPILDPSESKFCLPTQRCWPDSSEWLHLNMQLNGHLLKARSPLAPCYSNPQNMACKNILDDLKSPFFIESNPNLSQSNGWFNAWNFTISPYVAAVENVNEIATAVNFARQHRIKLVIKGTGHDYLGRSNAPDSLLIWTHHMRKITINNQFIPQGCKKNRPKNTAVTVEAGSRWLEVYKKVVVENGLYVQGGGCTSVGASGGFIQGGGFGSFSKKFGTGAASLLEAEIVTADGQVRVANECQNQDLFWALKGGGGGTFGVVSKVTLQTHALPPFFGTVNAKVKAKSDEDYKSLIRYFIRFYRDRLHNEHWGEQVIFSPDNELQLALVFQEINKVEVKALWQPFEDWLSNQSDKYTYTLDVNVLPARHFWDYNYLKKYFPDTILVDQTKSTLYGDFWWVGNQNEVSSTITHYQSTYLPYQLLDKDNAEYLMRALYDASRLVRLSLHFNKGLSGASNDAVTRQKTTSMNPKVLDAVALVTISGGQQYTYPGIEGHEPNYKKASESALKANQAMDLIRKFTLDSGTYGNESDYFLKNWQIALWGSNYGKLLEIKHKYDPDNLFSCHHCVGSE